MSRAYPVLFAFVISSAGCVPVTNPVGDIDKAEPDKALVGTWVSTQNSSDIVRFEVREVKGIPKGMMPMTVLGTSPERDPYWCFVSTVGKEKFGNLCMDFGGRKKDVLPDFGMAGAYGAGPGAGRASMWSFATPPARTRSRSTSGTRRPTRRIAQGGEAEGAEGCSVRDAGRLAGELHREERFWQDLPGREGGQVRAEEVGHAASVRAIWTGGKR